MGAVICAWNTHAARQAQLSSLTADIVAKQRTRQSATIFAEWRRQMISRKEANKAKVQLNTQPASAAAKAQEQMLSASRKETAGLSAPQHARQQWDMQASLENSALDGIFAGQEQSTTQCCVCNHRRLHFERTFTLEVHGECEQAFCKQKQPTKRFLGMSYLPNTLVVVLKRYEVAMFKEYDPVLNKQVDVPEQIKSHTAVSCPAVLDMAAYTSTGTFRASSTLLYDAVATKDVVLRTFTRLVTAGFLQ
ncbi:TPA: hypothetical protein ACH3X1_008276 [Trebouxia sp. C0004]